MGKRIDELKGLDDSPIEEPDARDTSWGRFLDEIDEMIGSGEYDWAEETLKGIYDTVEKKRWVTDAQRVAVAHIEAGNERRPTRRYEGFRRRR